MLDWPQPTRFRIALRDVHHRPVKRLTLAVPDLLALDRDTLAAAPSLGRLAHYAGPPVTRPGTLDALLVSASAIPDTAAAAPLAALGAGLDPGASYVLRADPVSLVAGRTDVALAARIDDLGVDETGALMATLNAHFGRDGLAFHAPRPDAWFVVVDFVPDLTTTPLSLVRGAIYPWLPGGNDAGRWRRWLSEMQMLLHEHPVNAVREARGCVPVTGLWISEGGRIAEASPSPASAIFATPGAAGDVARGLACLRGAAADAPPGSFAALPMHESATVVLDRATRANAPSFQSHWLGPAIAALEHGTLLSLSLLADGQGKAAGWQALRPTRSRRALAKFAARPFAPPLPDEDDA
jgi:hypothetical protein